MNKFEELEDEAHTQGVDVQKADLPNTISGLYYNDGTNPPLIAINCSVGTRAEACCVLAEELGHHCTSSGNLLTNSAVDPTIITQQEIRAKRWAVKHLVSIKSIIRSYESGAKDLYEMSEHLDVTEGFLREAFERYSVMYGKYALHGKYIIYFDPPGVLKAL